VLAFLSALLVAVPDCAEARNHYESLDLERAVEIAEAALDRGKERPLLCLEVRGLGLLVLGRPDEARESFVELFTKDPSYPIRDPSLSPSMTESIEAIRESVTPMSVSVRARWLVHESMRLDLFVEGGLRGARRVRYRTVTAPSEERYEGVIDLLGRSATATIAVTPGIDVARLSVSGSVLDARGRPLHEISSEILLSERPPPNEVLVESGGVGWPVWLGAGAAAIAATVAIVILAQPDLPSPGPQGRVKVGE
jgi:hypothetical protein